MTPEGKIHFANDSFIRYFDRKIAQFMDEFPLQRSLSETQNMVASCLPYVKKFLSLFKQKRQDDQQQDKVTNHIQE